MEVGPHSDHVVRSALAVFSLALPYTERDLDASYRRVALRCHPDKGGRRDLFETVADCYRVLQSHAERVGMWIDPDVNKTYDSVLDLRGRDDGLQERRTREQVDPARSPHSRGGGDERRREYGGGPPATSGSAFNVAEFNRRYEESRSRNAERDTGYASWMATAAGEFTEPSKPLINPKSGVGAFNSAFERHTPSLDSHTGALILRPAEASAGGLSGALLDDDAEVGDYTTDVGGGVTGADCRLAHGNQRLAAPAWARKEVAVDRASVGRLGAERDADIRVLESDGRGNGPGRGGSGSGSGSGSGRGSGGGGERDLAAEIGLALSGLRGARHD